jgi:NACalpha-BTF3-like transcription factor
MPPVFAMQVEQRELKQADTSKVAGAMKTFAAQQLAEKQAQMKKEKELAAVKVSESDIDIIASEFEIQKRQAERALRENKGDLQATIKEMIHS